MAFLSTFPFSRATSSAPVALSTKRVMPRVPRAITRSTLGVTLGASAVSFNTPLDTLLGSR